MVAVVDRVSSASAIGPESDESVAKVVPVTYRGPGPGVKSMVDDDRDCIDALTQISAIRAALVKAALGLLDGHTRHCLAGGHGGPTNPDEQADELMSAFGRLLTR